MRLFLKRVGLIGLVFTGLALLISMASLWSLRQGQFYKPSFLENAVKTTSFDYIVLGSSTGLTTLNTQVIDSVLGTQGLNLAMDDTALSSQYLMLQHFLASGKQAKTCILAASILDYDVLDYKLSGNDYRFLPYVSRNYVSNYYKAFNGRPARILWASKWFPMLGVGYYNTELFYPALVTLVSPQKRNRFDAKGNYSYPITSKHAEPITKRKMRQIHFKNKYLQAIQELCEQQGMDFVVYLSPHKNLLAKPVDSPFNVINHSNLLNNKQYFYDEVHVNSLGRQRVSLRFANDASSIIGL